MRQIFVAHVANTTSPVTRTESITWDSLVKMLESPVVGEKDGPAWIPGNIEPGPRQGKRVQSISTLVLDIEAQKKGNLPASAVPHPDVIEDTLNELGFAWILHTTFGHTHATPRYRLLFDLSRPLVDTPQGHEIKQLGPHFGHLLGISQFVDSSCLEPARLFFLPRCPAERISDFVFKMGDGIPIDVDAMLAEEAQLKTAAADTGIVVRDLSQSAGGSVINAFNAQVDIGQILESHNYKRCAPTRWLFSGSESGVPGVHLLPGSGTPAIYSFHAADPLADGRRHDAIDVFRILEHGGDMRAAIKAAAMQMGMSHHDAYPVIPLNNQDPVTTAPPVTAPQQATEAAASIKFPAPFRGPMLEAVEATLSSSQKQQPELCTLAALLGMSVGCSGGFALPSGMRLNLYGCGVADTGEGKEAPRHLGVGMACAAEARTIGKPASAAGLEDSLQSLKGLLIPVDEAAHFFEALVNPRTPPHLIELAGLILQLFSVSKSSYRTRVKASSEDHSSQLIEHPMVGFLGFSTPQKLGTALGVGNVEDGLLGRFLFCFGRPDASPRRINTSFRLPDSVVSRGEEIKQIIQKAPNPAEIGIVIQSDAEARLAELMLEFDAARRSSQSPFGKALLVRSLEKCERIAGVLAVWDQPAQPEVTIEHVGWAEQFIRASDLALMRFAGEYMHGGQVQSNADRLLKLASRALRGEFKPQKPHEHTLMKQGIAPVSMLMRAAKIDKRGFDEALSHLVDLAEIQIVQLQSAHPNGRNLVTRGVTLL
jgi:hypothetical protein